MTNTSDTRIVARKTKALRRIEQPPPCAPWCTRRHPASKRGWDFRSPVDAGRWCTHTVGSVGGWKIWVEQFHYADYRTARSETPKVRLEHREGDGPESGITPAQAEFLARLLRQAREMLTAN